MHYPILSLPIFMLAKPEGKVIANVTHGNEGYQNSDITEAVLQRKSAKKILDELPTRQFFELLILDAKKANAPLVVIAPLGDYKSLKHFVQWRQNPQELPLAR